MMDMSKYKGMFIEESAEHLKNMNQLLMTLEKEPGEEHAITTLFREYHSVKGMAASMGYIPIQELSHSLEDLLDQIRKKKIPVSRVYLNLLFTGTDHLERMLDDITADRDIAEIPVSLMETIRTEERKLKQDNVPVDQVVIFDDVDVMIDQIADEAIVDGDIVDIDVEVDEEIITEADEVIAADDHDSLGDRDKKKRPTSLNRNPPRP